MSRSQYGNAPAPPPESEDFGFPLGEEVLAAHGLVKRYRRRIREVRFSPSSGASRRSRPTASFSEIPSLVASRSTLRLVAGSSRTVMRDSAAMHASSGLAA